MYKLTPDEQADNGLFFRMDGETADRHGAIGYMRADFGNSGREFHTTWFDNQPYLKTGIFKERFDELINSLRDEGQEPFASRNNLAAYCAVNRGKKISDRGDGYVIKTLDYSFYLRCLPRPGDYDIYCFCYDNRWLLPELSGKHELPNDCFSVLPSNGELIFIVMGENGYFQQGQSTDDPDRNRQIATGKNALLGITRAQEEAMLGGSLFGWNTPAAKPWNYDKNGKPQIKPAQQKNEPER